MSIEYFSKHVDVDDLDQLTFGRIKKEIATRKKELATEKHKGIKLCMDTDQWILRAAKHGHIKIIVPGQLV
jgi:hypothetical protein